MAHGFVSDVDAFEIGLHRSDEQHAWFAAARRVRLIELFVDDLADVRGVVVKLLADRYEMRRDGDLRNRQAIHRIDLRLQISVRGERALVALTEMDRARACDAKRRLDGAPERGDDEIECIDVDVIE